MMTSQLYIGNPPANIIAWIKAHSQPIYHEDTWYKYANDTEWRTVSITGTISGNNNNTPTT